MGNVMVTRVRVGALCAASFLACAAPCGDRPPAPADVRKLIEEAAGPDAASPGGAEARLRDLARRFPAVFEAELLRLRGQERVVSRLLGDEGEESAAVGLFLSGKLREAQQAFDAKSFEQAQAICEALLILGAGEGTQVRAKRLLRLARDRAFADSILLVDLRAANDVIATNEPIELVLAITNRSDEPVTIGVDPKGILGQLTASSVGVAPTVEIFSKTFPEDLKVSSAEISIAAGESWEHAFALETGAPDAPLLVEGIRVSGRLVPRHIGAGSRTITRILRIPSVVVLRVPEGRAPAVQDPVKALEGAIASDDAEGLVLSTALAAWDGEFERALELLLKGTAAESREIVETSFVLARLLTGENFGRDRRKWIVYFLSHERLPFRGPFSEW
jgi:hypothetical protein